MAALTVAAIIQHVQCTYSVRSSSRLTASWKSISNPRVSAALKSPYCTRITLNPSSPLYAFSPSPPAAVAEPPARPRSRATYPHTRSPGRTRGRTLRDGAQETLPDAFVEAGPERLDRAVRRRFRPDASPRDNQLPFVLARLFVPGLALLHQEIAKADVREAEQRAGTVARVLARGERREEPVLIDGEAM